MRDFHLSWTAEGLAEAKARDAEAFTSSDTQAEAFSKRYRREALHASIEAPSPVTGCAGEGGLRDEPSNPPRTPMTNTPDQLDLEGLESAAKAATPGPWTHGACHEDFVSVYAPEGAGGSIGKPVICDTFLHPRNGWMDNAAFIAAWNPATALSILSRLRASEAECERLRNNGHHQALRARDAEALATSQAETIKGLVEAATRYLDAGDAYTAGAKDRDDVALMLAFGQAEQGLRSALASTRTPSGEDRPDNGSDGGEGV